MIVADYSQIELRVAALISQDRAMLGAYRKGEDLHRKTAASIPGIAPEEVTKDQRQMAKAVNFGLLFGQGAEGLRLYAKATYGVNMTVGDAEKAQSAFFRTYPQLKQWQIKTAGKAKRSNVVHTKGGRIRDFSKEPNGYRYTEALNTPIQGTAAEIMLVALAELDRRLKGASKLINIIHDEIVVEAAEQNVDIVKSDVEQAMVEGYLAVFPDANDTLKGLVEAHSGKNWIEAKS